MFTESKRTQKYIAAELRRDGFEEDDILLFNGDFDDAMTNEIYRAWQVKNHGNTNYGRSVEYKHAIVDYFKEHARILIVTDAARMSAGECSYLADAVFSNLMAEYKRIAGICSNTGMATLVRIHPELASKEHMFLETLDKNGDARYRNILEQTHTRYFSLLDQAETAQEG